MHNNAATLVMKIHPGKNAWRREIGPRNMSMAAWNPVDMQATGPDIMTVSLDLLTSKSPTMLRD
jgi:hypothetical protein